MPKKKAKRYTSQERQKILDFIDAKGRGGQTAAVKKFGVTAATISSWKKKAEGSWASGRKVTGDSKELKALKELLSLLSEIEATQKKLGDLQKRYDKAKKRI